MSETFKYSLVFVGCLLVSVAGIIAGGLYCHPLDGTRGGAVAVGAALATMFLSRDYGVLPIDALLSHLAWIKRRLERSPPEANLSSVAKRLDAIEQDIIQISQAIRASQAITGRDTRWQNKFLAASSVVGTAAWGFGDWASQWIMTTFTTCPTH